MRRAVLLIAAGVLLIGAGTAFGETSRVDALYNTAQIGISYDNGDYAKVDKLLQDAVGDRETTLAISTSKHSFAKNSLIILQNQRIIELLEQIAGQKAKK